jgi:type IV pilus assembly protein PilP
MKKNNKTFLNISILMMFIFFIYACSDNQHKDLRNHINSLKEMVNVMKVKSSLQPITEPKPATYQGSQLRAPFDSLENTNKVQGQISKNPLQAYPLSVLRFVGTASQENRSVAFITTPNNMVYQVKTGDIIGDHADEVMEINADNIKVMVKEIQDGKLVQHYITLRLKDSMDAQ